MLIRRLQPRDGAFLLQLRQVFGAAFEEQIYLQSLFPLEEAERLLTNDQVAVWVALGEEGKVKGGLQAYVLPSMAEPGFELYAYNLAVEEGSRRQGCGSALIEAALAYAEEKGMRSVFVQVHEEDEDAHRLYRRFSRHWDSNVTQYELDS